MNSLAGSGLHSNSMSGSNLPSSYNSAPQMNYSHLSQNMPSINSLPQGGQVHNVPSHPVPSQGFPDQGFPPHQPNFPMGGYLPVDHQRQQHLPDNNSALLGFFTRNVLQSASRQKLQREKQNSQALQNRARGDFVPLRGR